MNPYSPSPDGSEHEPVLALAVDSADALELGLRPGDDQPLVTGAVEVQVGYLELELGCAPVIGGSLRI